MIHWKQHLTTMVIDKIRKMSIKGVKLSQKVSFQYLLAFWSYGAKNLRGADSPPPGPDKVKIEGMEAVVWPVKRVHLFTHPVDI